MQNLKTIRKRIGSVKKTQQITKAMKMIAAVRLRKAQEQIWSYRPYAKQLRETMSRLAIRSSVKDHPLFAHRHFNRILLCVVTSHRGLCGSFNTNVIRHALEFFEEHDQRERFLWAFSGNKGYQFFSKRNINIFQNYPDAVPIVTFEKASQMAQAFEHAFLKEEVDAVFVLYNEFRSAMVQDTICEQLLPLQPAKLPPDMPGTDFIYEPNKEAIVADLLNKYFRVQMYRILSESVAGEHAARMTAMDNATNNASEMIRSLTLDYNRMRQASITKELIEIVTGKEALES